MRKDDSETCSTRSLFNSQLYQIYINFVYFQWQMHPTSQLCFKCRNNHNGQCSTQITYFFWFPHSQSSAPKMVEIVGSWHQWQSQLLMQREQDQKGNVYFEIGLGLEVGVYEYKYIVDGVWKHQQNSKCTDDNFGGYNNYIQVLPKTAIRQSYPKQQTKINSGIDIEGLGIVGSWDNWNSETKMERVYNNLRGQFENTAHLSLKPNCYYQFKFKLGNQYLIGQNYPTARNQFGTLNHYIFIKDALISPIGFKTNSSTKQSLSPNCRAFTWEHCVVQSDMSYHKQLLHGHSICQIGENIYVFGGILRNDFTNRFVKISIHRLNIFHGQQIMPIERAFHHAIPYGNKMILYGGHNKSILQDYSVFNTINCSWQAAPAIKGQYPQQCQNNTCVLYQNYLVLFGGYYYSSDLQIEQTYNHISMLDLKMMKWVNRESIKVTGPSPSPRYSHTATIIRSDMYVFGGRQLNQNLNDIWMINLEEVTNLKWELKEPKGAPPQPRHGHSCNAIKQYLVIYGGLNQKILGDVVVYGIENNQWIYPVIDSRVVQPSPRAFHGSTSINNQYIVLFGGKNQQFQTTNMYILRPKNLRQLQIQLLEEQQEEKKGQFYFQFEE